MKTAIHLRLRHATGIAAVLSMFFTGCTKEELILPLQQPEVSATVDTDDESREARVHRKEISIKEKSLRLKDPLGETAKDNIEIRVHRRQEVVEETGGRVNRSIAGHVREKQISVHGTHGLAIFNEQQAVLLDRKEILGQNKGLELKSDGKSVKTTIHDALDFTPARSEFKETGARED